MASTELVIRLGYGRSAAAGITGPQSEFLTLQRSSGDELLGVHFRCGGAFPFVAPPMPELHGRSVGLSELWGEQTTQQLLDSIHDAKSIDDKFHVLERWLMNGAPRPFRRDPAVAFAMREFYKNSGASSSAAMAERVGLSQRRFIELFQKEVGLTPKLFCRLQRFQHVIRTVHKSNDVNWADVALTCGYFDQSHFNHEFREFSGLTPTQYLPLRTDHLNHVQAPES